MAHSIVMYEKEKNLQNRERDYVSVHGWVCVCERQTYEALTRQNVGAEVGINFVPLACVFVLLV